MKKQITHIFVFVAMSVVMTSLVGFNAFAREVLPVKLQGKLIPKGVQAKISFSAGWSTSEARPQFSAQGPCQGSNSPNPWCTCSKPGTGSGCTPEYTDFVMSHYDPIASTWEPVGCYSRSSSPDCAPYSSYEPYPESNSSAPQP